MKQHKQSNFKLHFSIFDLVLETVWTLILKCNFQVALARWQLSENYTSNSVGWAPRQNYWVHVYKRYW